MSRLLFLGLALGTACLLGAILVEGNPLPVFFSPAALLVVLGGSVGATLIGCDRREVAQLPRNLVPRGELPSAAGILRRWSLQARREGLLSLEGEVSRISDPFLRAGLAVIVEGAESDVLDQVLRTRMKVEEERYEASARLLESLGGYCPTFGITGTVVGLMGVLGRLEQPDRLGEGVAVAFVATFYGLVLANLLFLPLAAGVRRRWEQRREYLEMLAVGLRSIQAGESPLLLDDRIGAFARAGEADERAA